MTSTEEAFTLLAGANERLGHAETSLRVGMYGPAVSLAYYAAYHAAQAIIAYHRRSAKTHRGIRGLFWALAVEGSDIPPEVGKLINGLARNRVKADYTAIWDWDEVDAAEAVGRAQTFVNEVYAWFHRHHG